ncbi:MAG: hypothetical protein ACI80H_001091 [Pseudoalteromonas distincta]|jgi:hypothetical protein
MHKNVILAFLLFSYLGAAAQSKTQSSWQQQVDYMVDVKLDDVNHILDGEIVITYTNNSPDTISFMFIHLWPNAYKNNTTAFAKQMEENGEMDFYYSKDKDRGFIEGLDFKSGGVKLKVDATENLDVVKVMLAKPIKTGEQVTLFTPFRVKIPKVFSRLGHENQDYFITQWYPKPAVYDVNGWNPMPYLNMGEFYSEFGSFKVNVTVPANYTIVATGECQNADELGETKVGTVDSVPPSDSRLKTVKFEANNVHDFAWFASKRWGYVTKKIKVGEREVVARVVAAEPDIVNLKHIETAITYYSNNVGLYPYSHATVVHGELKAGGGMEYPMITLCDFMSEEVIVHEVGHNWFYGILANNERRYPWMDESINSYYEGQAMQKEDSKILDINGLIMNALVKDNMLLGEHQAIATASAELTEGNYGMSVYGIGSCAFGYLKAYLGDGIFKKCMLAYYETWKFKHPLPDDMKKSFEATSGKSLTWFFDEVLQTDKKIDYAVCKHKQGFELKNKSAIAAPIPLQVTANGKKTTTWYEVFPGESIILPSAAKDRSAQIDAFGETLDFNLGNNKTDSKVKLKFGSGIDKPEFKEVYVLPALGWNAYDRLMLGLSFHNYAIANKSLQYMVIPLYSFEKKSFNGIAAVSYTMPLDGAGEHLIYSLDAKSFNFEERGSFGKDYKYLKVAPSIEYVLPKSNQRSPINRSIKLAYNFIELIPDFDINRSEKVSIIENEIERNRQFFTLDYKLENKSSINGFSLDIGAQYGLISSNSVLADLANPTPFDSTGRRFFPHLKDSLTSANLLTVSSIFKYDLDIGLKNKPLQFRAYGSYIFDSPDATIYKNTIGSGDKAGLYDYRFDEYLMHRNATYGMFQNQISNRRAFSKFVGLLASNETWLLDFQVSIPLPGKIPVRPYVEFMAYDDLDKETWNSTGKKLIYNLGLELQVIPDRLEIFFNLAQSSIVTDYQENTLIYPANINGFAERITFVLDLNGLMPQKLKRQLKMF